MSNSLSRRRGFARRIRIPVRMPMEALAVAAAAIAGPVGSAAGAADEQLGRETAIGAFAGLRMAGRTPELEIWRIPGSDVRLLIDSERGAVFAARLLWTPEAGSGDAFKYPSGAPVEFDECGIATARGTNQETGSPLQPPNGGADPVLGLGCADCRSVARQPSAWHHACPAFPDSRADAAAEAADSPTAEIADFSRVPQAAEILAALRTEAFWFSVGRDGAAVAYAVLDPGCPHCARAMLNLRHKVERGEVQVRVVPVAALGDGSEKLLAAILADPAPAEAFWRHEIQLATFGSSDLASGEIGQLDSRLRSAIRSNLELASRLGIAGVPYFAFMDRYGARVRSGVPSADEFDGALPDGFPGLAR